MHWKVDCCDAVGRSTLRKLDPTQNENCHDDAVAPQPLVSRGGLKGEGGDSQHAGLRKYGAISVSFVFSSVAGVKFVPTAVSDCFIEYLVFRYAVVYNN